MSANCSCCPDPYLIRGYPLQFFGPEAYEDNAGLEKVPRDESVLGLNLLEGHKFIGLRVVDA